MNRFFYDGVITGETVRYTDQDEIKHLEKVLRLGPGDTVELCDLSGNVYLATILSGDKNEVLFKCVDAEQGDSELPMHVHLFQGLPKSGKMDLIIQKNVELGTAAIQAVEFHRCVSRLKDDKGKLDRWQKIADEASKQAKRNKRTTIQESLSFKAFMKQLEGFDLILLPYEKSESSLKAALPKTVPSRVAIIIGPEGGFEAAEVEAIQALGAKVVSLGKRILRTETASLFVVSALAFCYEDQI